MATKRWRHEWKYWITWGQHQILRQRLRALLPQDDHANARGEYRVRSLYFDTLRDDHAFDKLAGLKGRAKYRIRIYDPEDQWARLEVKHRSGYRVSKEGVRITREEACDLIAGRVRKDDARDPALTRLNMALRRNLARPAVIVDYVREPYVYVPGNVRITFDKHLATAPFDNNLYSSNLGLLPVPLDSDLILEIKYDGFLPLAIKRLFPSSIVGPVAASKYMLCRPTLNRWENGT